MVLSPTRELAQQVHLMYTLHSKLQVYIYSLTCFMSKAPQPIQGQMLSFFLEPQNFSVNFLMQGAGSYSLLYKPQGCWTRKFLMQQQILTRGSNRESFVP